MLALNRELGEARDKPFQETEFLDRLKEEVVDKFNFNFLQIQ